LSPNFSKTSGRHAMPVIQPATWSGERPKRPQETAAQASCTRFLASRSARDFGRMKIALQRLPDSGST
jgi:hypothetical protein